jgi:hypothetical protein
VQAESAKEGSETPRRLRCAPRQQARRAAAMGQVGVGELRQAAARWPCSACARAALTTALHCAAVGMDRGPGVVRGSSSGELRDGARDDCGKDGVCGARGRVQRQAAQQSHAAWTCVRWDSVGGQQALLSAAVTAARAVQGRLCLLCGLERAVGPLAARSGVAEAASTRPSRRTHVSCALPPPCGLCGWCERILRQQREQHALL